MEGISIGSGSRPMVSAVVSYPKHKYRCQTTWSDGSTNTVTLGWRQEPPYVKLKVSCEDPDFVCGVNTGSYPQVIVRLRNKLTDMTAYLHFLMPMQDVNRVMLMNMDSKSDTFTAVSRVWTVPTWGVPETL